LCQPVTRSLAGLGAALVMLAAPQKGGGGLLVGVYSKLFLIQPDGTQDLLADRANGGVLSTDGRHVAFTIVTLTTQSLVVLSLEDRTRRELLTLPQGSYFHHVGWAPDGKALAYEVIVRGKSDELVLAPFPPERGPPRSLGPWYQGFSISPDGSQIVHAVYDRATGAGLEVLDVATGKRTLVHKTEKALWDARFSPDGRFIAYTITLHEPSPSDEPDCTPPTLGLRVYSVAMHTDIPVTMLGAPPDWEDVKNFAWSPDSKRLAVTLGTTDCDYPGNASGIFVTTLDLKAQVRASTSPLSFEPAFSPDGAAVAFVDFSESPAKLLRYELATAQLTLIRRATERDNYYHLFGWR